MKSITSPRGGKGATDGEFFGQSGSPFFPQELIILVTRRSQLIAYLIFGQVYLLGIRLTPHDQQL